jgi:hypothetical protein
MILLYQDLSKEGHGFSAAEIQRQAVLPSEHPVYLCITFSFLRLAQGRELEAPL